MLTGPSLRFLILIVSTTQLSFIFPYDLFSALKNFWMAEDMSRGRLIMGIYLGYHGVHPAVLKMNARRPENSLPSGFHRVWFWQEMSGQTWLAELQIQLLEVSQDQNLSLSSNGSCAWIKIRFLKKILSAAKTRGENSQYLDLIGHKWDFSLNIYKFTKWLFFFPLSVDLVVIASKNLKFGKIHIKILTPSSMGNCKAWQYRAYIFAYKTTGQSLTTADTFGWTGVPRALWIPVTSL